MVGLVVKEKSQVLITGITQSREDRKKVEALKKRMNIKSQSAVYAQALQWFYDAEFPRRWEGK